jgi:ABC-type phosphate transport system permease subunit
MSASVSLLDKNSNLERAEGHDESGMTIAVADEAQRLIEVEWQPSKHEKAIIYTLAISSLIVALDATIIITPLSVSTQVHSNIL